MPSILMSLLMKVQNRMKLELNILRPSIRVLSPMRRSQDIPRKKLTPRNKEPSNHSNLRNILLLLSNRRRNLQRHIRLRRIMRKRITRKNRILLIVLHNRLILKRRLTPQPKPLMPPNRRMKRQHHILRKSLSLNQAMKAASIANKHAAQRTVSV
jgi:hypothetical protein